MRDLTFGISAKDKYSAQLGKLNREIRTTERQFGRAESMAGKLGKRIIGLGAAYVTLSSGLAVVRKVIDATSEQQSAVSQLNATLRSTGDAVGLSSAQLQRYAAELQNVTTYGDEKTIKMMSQLATFTKISGDNFKRASVAVLDMAEKLDTDLKSAVVQVGKALNDPIKGVTALGRAGVQFTEDQKDMIGAMVEAGDIAGAQALVLKELEVQFGGSAVAARDTLGGALDALGNAWGDNFEFMGEGSAQLQGKIEDLTVALSDPRIKEGLENIASVLLFIASEAVPVIARLMELNDWVVSLQANAVQGFWGGLYHNSGVKNLFFEEDQVDAQVENNLRAISNLKQSIAEIQETGRVSTQLMAAYNRDTATAVIQEIEHEISDLIDLNKSLKESLPVVPTASPHDGFVRRSAVGTIGNSGEETSEVEEQIAALKKLNENRRDAERSANLQAEAERKAHREREKLTDLLQTAVNDRMPWRKMRDEALALEQALKAVGGQLDGAAVASVRSQIDALRREAHEAQQSALYGVDFYDDNLEEIKVKGLDVADAWEERFIDVFSNIFTSANGDLDDLGKNILDMFAQIGAQSIGGLLDGSLLAANDNRASSSQLNKREISSAVQEGSFGGVTKGLTYLFQEFGGMSQGQAGKAAGGAVGIAGGAFGAFGIGAASGSAGMGMLGGALSGVGTASSLGASLGGAGLLGPAGLVLGAVGGALLGGLGGLFGGGGPNRKDQLREFRGQRSQELEEAQGQLSSFIDQISGRGIGEATDELRSLRDTTKQFERLIMDATGDASDTQMLELQSAYNNRVNELYDTFVESIPAVTRSLEAGIGFAGAYEAANDNIKDASLQVQGYINDIKELNDLQGVSENDVAQIAQVIPSLEKYLVSFVTGAEGMSEVEQAMQRIAGASAGLGEALQDLGYSADRSAQIMRDAQAEGTQNVRQDFLDDVNSALNVLSGFGYLNQFSALSEEFLQLQQDAVLVGGGVDQVRDLTRRSALNIIQDAGLSEQAITDLLARFPELRTALGSVDEIMVDLTTHTMDRVEAENQLRTAYQRQEQELTSLIDRLQQSRGSLQDFASSVLLDQATSPLSLSARLEEAQRQYQDAYVAAQSGDPEAVSSLSEIRRSLLDIAREAYGSTSGYTDILEQVRRDNSSLITVVDREISIAQMQLDSARDQVSQLININDNVIGLQDALAQYHTALSGVGAPGDLPSDVGIGGGSGGDSGFAGGVSSVLSDAGYVDSLYQTYLRRDPDAQGRSFWLSHLQGGMSRAELEQAFINSDEAQQLSGSYQLGGLISNGVYNKDSVIARFAGGGAVGLAGGEYVTRAGSVTPETYPTLEAINRTGRAPSSPSDALLKEIAALRDEVKALRSVSQAVGRATVENGVETNRLLARNVERQRLQGRKAS